MNIPSLTSQRQIIKAEKFNNHCGQQTSVNKQKLLNYCKNVAECKFMRINNFKSKFYFITIKLLENVILFNAKLLWKRSYR